jgi:hypothetical protein
MIKFAIILVKIFKMATKLRYLFIFIIFIFLSFLFGLSVSRHIYIGGSLIEKYEIQIFNLSEILPNIYHFLKNSTDVVGLFVPIKKTINEAKFNVPGLYSFMNKDGWVILDKSETKEIIIPINWEKLKMLYYQHCINDKFNICINSKFAAAPINPLKINNHIIFHLGGVLFKYSIKKNEFYAFEGIYHHSIEPFQDSLIFVCSYNTDTLGFINDAICLININTNSILYKKSIPSLMLKNNLSSLLLGISRIKIVKNDFIHLNDIQPVRQSTNFAISGDLFLSLRNLSTVILYRPSLDTILWHSTGPWLNQHDVDVIDENIIGIYNNNNTSDFNFQNNTYSNISTYNFKTKKYGTIYQELFKSLKIQSVVSSRFEILDDGNMFVEDSPSGMYYLISKEGLLECSKSFPFDKKNTVKSQWARPYTFKKY